MPKEKMLWSLNGLSSVRSSKLREFRIEELNTFEGIKFRLAGYFKKNEFFFFGLFDEVEPAKAFLEEIHSKIEGRK